MTTPTRLYCFDFDNTIVDGHYHNELNKKGVKPGKATLGDINTLLVKHPILNQSKLLETFRSILKNDHHLAITAWNEYPEVIPWILRILGLTEDEIAKVHIESGFPTSFDQGKSEHIEKAKKHFNVTDNRFVWLIDDDEKHIAQAKKDGQLTVHVTTPQTSTDYLTLIQHFLKPRVQIASLDTVEGKRLHEVREKLRTNTRPAPRRKDGEKPLTRFLAKNPPVAHTENPRVQIASLDTLEGKRLHEAREKLRKDNKIPAPTRKDNEKPLTRFLAKNTPAANTEKPKEDNVNPSDVKKGNNPKNTRSTKVSNIILLSGIVLGIAFWYFSIPFIAHAALYTFLSLELAGRLLLSIHWKKEDAIQERDKDTSKWMTENKSAYDLGAECKHWMPYLKSFVKPKAYSSAFRIGLDDVLEEEKRLGTSLRT
jgi:hypothetical protein